MKIKEKVMNGLEKVKGFASKNKKKIIAGAAVVGGTILGAGVLGKVMNHGGDEDDYLEESYEVDVYESESDDNPDTEDETTED